MVSRTGHGEQLTFYDWGATPFYALQKDPRVSYCLFIPPSYEEHGDARYNLIVLIHGTERGAATYRDKFADFAEDHNCIVLAPLFPVGLAGPGDLDSYKLIRFADFRFDELLLAMVDEAAAKYRLSSDKFMLHGFSGGGHFAHRFFYLHPDRLQAVSIGAPGVVTLLDEGRDWWVGVRDIEDHFGVSILFDALAKVPVQMIVGEEDTQTWEITIPETSSWWMEGANSAGKTRIERLRSLQTSFEKQNIQVQFDTVPGIAHDGWSPLLLSKVRTFFRAALSARAGNEME